MTLATTASPTLSAVHMKSARSRRWSQLARKGVIVKAATTTTSGKPSTMSGKPSTISGTASKPKTIKEKKTPKSSKSASMGAQPMWLPGLDPPKHLDGSMPGDYGFDPLELGKKPATLAWFRQAELQHARWAMLGAAGVLFTTAFGFTDWYIAGDKILQNFPVPLGTLIGAQILLMNFVEVKRWADIRKPGSQAKKGTFAGFESAFGENIEDVGYPGGPLFNPLKLNTTPERLWKMKQRELANGRLAMVSCLGFFAQYQVTGKNPLVNLSDHVDSPLLVNFATNGVSLPPIFE